MHELSIAISIVEIAEEKAKEFNVVEVKEIELEIGKLSGVVYDALEFAMEEAVKNTVLRNAKRTIAKIQGKARCLSCSFEFEVEDVYSPCPRCGEFNSEIIQGKELMVKSLIID